MITHGTVFTAPGLLTLGYQLVVASSDQSLLLFQFNFFLLNTSLFTFTRTLYKHSYTIIFMTMVEAQTYINIMEHN